MAFLVTLILLISNILSYVSIHSFVVVKHSEMTKQQQQLANHRLVTHQSCVCLSQAIEKEGANIFYAKNVDGIGSNMKLESFATPYKQAARQTKIDGSPHPILHINRGLDRIFPTLLLGAWISITRILRIL